MSGWDVQNSTDGLEIAIVGMSGRFPDAPTVDTFWQNLRNGVESISFFDDEELRQAGVPADLLQNPNYVKARGVLQDVDRFDADFFGLYPREAQQLDPQQRIFLECAWEALEDAGYDVATYPGAIGVFGGVGMNTYLLSHLMANGHGMETTQLYQLAIANDKDFLTTRISYKLNLHGPSMDVQTACSTSLVAVHVACQSLLNYESDMALAGGVSILLPQEQGYLAQEGMILSPDGHCRAFDADAAGTLSSNGAGIVVLKRLEDALVDGDHIYAVIKGSAVNNDGSNRAGYTAPSVDGQAAVVATAQALAGVEPATIDYIEAHGTGTPLGDPIEITALTQAFRERTDETGFCAIGSVKTNVGHLDAAAGVAGLIKTALSLQHSQIPPSLHFTRPNPRLDLDNSPFYVNASLAEWERGRTPRRAGVSSFGIGGTNAHVVLEEAPEPAATSPSRPWQLLVLSAKTESALETATENLAAHLAATPTQSLADAAFTLQVGRKAFDHRRILVCRSHEDAVDALRQRDPRRLFTAARTDASIEPPLLFMFSGQGSQYPDMAKELYQTEPTFRQIVDECSERLQFEVGSNLRDLIYPPLSADGETAAHQLKQTAIAQPALFVVEYALARLLMEWGLAPQAMIGHSIGEYAAACLSGVISLEDALHLVAVRGRLMQTVPGGAMIGVSLPEDEIRAFLDPDLSLAAANDPSSCVVSGTHEAIDALEARLAQQGIGHRRLHTSHAFHSAMMDPILDSFVREVEQIPLHPPQIPYISNVTGTWITAEEATDPGYYARHLRQTVRFSDGVATLLAQPDAVFLEVGPGRTLCSLVKGHAAATTDHVVLNSIRHPNERHSDSAFLLNALGRLWLAGVAVDWSGFYTHERRRRVRLPTYPFERQRYWLDRPASKAKRIAAEDEAAKKQGVGEWFYIPSWRRADRVGTRRSSGQTARSNWLLFADEHGLASQLAARLVDDGEDVITVQPGRQFEPIDERTYALKPDAGDHYVRLLQALAERSQMPQKIVHCWSVTPDHRLDFHADGFVTAQTLGLTSLLYLMQALSSQNVTAPLHLDVITTNVQEVTGNELLHPGKATLLGVCRAVPWEHPNVTCRTIDLALSCRSALTEANGQIANNLVSPKLLDDLIDELKGEATETTVAYRGRHRWTQVYEPIHRAGQAEESTRLRQKGVYLITGGLGRIGLVMATHLAQTVQARLVLVGRSAFPPHSQWAEWLETHEGEDEISRTIRTLLAMEESGAQVLILQADVAQEQQMRNVVDQARKRFGDLHGVIHAAGDVGLRAIRPIHETSADVVQSQFQAKVHGANVLADVLKGENLDFCLLFSSLASVLGGWGFTAYAAANQYMDTLAHRQHQQGKTAWISVNWDRWHWADGQTQKTATLTNLEDPLIDPAEGMAALQRLLTLDAFPQIAVSTVDLNARARGAQHVQRATAETTHKDREHDAALATAQYARPDLQTPYIAPKTALEQEIAAILQEHLGIEPIGIYDSFFDLGGNSLLGTQVVAQLRSKFQVELPLSVLFEDATVAGIAQAIETEREATQDQTTRIAAVLEQLENLSEEEVHALLAAKELSS